MGIEASGTPPAWRSPSTSPDHLAPARRCAPKRSRTHSARACSIVRYAHVESMWMGETAKNVVAAFRQARKENAVLLFDEADAIASRRSSSLDQSFVRESNTVVSVLLQELERFSGVVIFATNLAANLDPAFERRIRTHVLFEMPGVVEREADLARAGAPVTHAAGRRCGFPRTGRTIRDQRRGHPERRAQGRARRRGGGRQRCVQGRFTSSISRRVFGRSSPGSG